MRRASPALVPPERLRISASIDPTPSDRQRRGSPRPPLRQQAVKVAASALGIGVSDQHHPCPGVGGRTSDTRPEEPRVPRPWRQQVPPPNATTCRRLRCKRGRQDRDRNSEQRPAHARDRREQSTDRDRRDIRSNQCAKLTRGCKLRKECSPGHFEQGKGRPTTCDREADREAGEDNQRNRDCKHHSGGQAAKLLGRSRDTDPTDTDRKCRCRENKERERRESQDIEQRHSGKRQPDCATPSDPDEHHGCTEHQRRQSQDPQRPGIHQGIDGQCAQGPGQRRRSFCLRRPNDDRVFAKPIENAAIIEIFAQLPGGRNT